MKYRSETVEGRRPLGSAYISLDGRMWPGLKGNTTGPSAPVTGQHDDELSSSDLPAPQIQRVGGRFQTCDVHFKTYSCIF
jgi:hypothetical protein